MIPLVFLHGFLGSPKDWEELFSYLPEFAKIAIELPGHGETPFSPHLHLPDVPKMHLIGYSMGGRLALQYARSHPEKIASLTLLSTHLGLNSSLGKEQRLQSDTLLGEKIIQSFDDFLHSWYDQAIFAGFKPDMTQRKKHSPQELAKSLLHFSLGHQPCFSVDVNCLAVGEKDTKYRNLYPNAYCIQNAGHMVHMENPKQVAYWIRGRIL
jgi:2-succinyl-6-hydroxy-2,4-cyclohexadiene-1-carboxylate synthase